MARLQWQRLGLRRATDRVSAEPSRRTRRLRFAPSSQAARRGPQHLLQWPGGSLRRAARPPAIERHASGVYWTGGDNGPRARRLSLLREARPDDSRRTGGPTRYNGLTSPLARRAQYRERPELTTLAENAFPIANQDTTDYRRCGASGLLRGRGAEMQMKMWIPRDARRRRTRRDGPRGVGPDSPPPPAENDRPADAGASVRAARRGEAASSPTRRKAEPTKRARCHYRHVAFRSP